jgi:hypothetical protein
MDKPKKRIVRGKLAKAIKKNTSKTKAPPIPPKSNAKRLLKGKLAKLINERLGRKKKKPKGVKTKKIVVKGKLAQAIKKNLEKKTKDVKKKRRKKFKIKKPQLVQLARTTGLTKTEANKKNPLELFSMLPKELIDNFIVNDLTPKVEDVDLGDILDEDPEIYDQANDNYFTSLSYSRSQYEERGLLSEREAGFYFYVMDNREDTTERQRQKYDDLTDQVLERGSEYLMEELQRFYKDFQDENKGKRATIKEIADQFSDYYL